MKKRVARGILCVFLGSLVSAAGQAFADGTPAWKSVGPQGGFVNALAVHPSTATTVFCGFRDGGVYRTTNGGATWRPVGRGVVDPYVYVLAVDRAQPGTIYAGTRTGVYKSANAGTTWSAANGTLLNERSIRCLAVHPVLHHILYAGSYEHGIYKSANGGATWTWMNNSLSYETIWQFEIDPLHPNTLYACAGDIGLHKSTDGGATWTFMGRSGYSSGLAIDPFDSRILYLIAGGFWKSTDGGTTWTALSIKAYPFALAVDRSRPGVLYIGTINNGILKTTDYGATWSLVNTGLTYPEVYALASSAIDTVYAGTAINGVFRTRNGGASWVSAGKGLVALPIFELVFDGRTAGTFYAACDPGLLKGTGGGARWTDLTPPNGRMMFVPTAAVHPRNPLIIYAAFQALGSSISTLGLQKSTDGGATWRSLGLKLDGIGDIAIDPVLNNRVFAVSFDKGIYRSQNGGASWAYAGLKSKSPGRIVFDPSAPGRIYAATVGGIYRGSVTGKTWTPAGLQLYNVYSLIVDPNGVMYAGTGGKGVFKSTDSGAHWTAMNAGLPSCLYINALTINPQNPQDLFAGVSDLGVYRSKNGGSSWAYMGAGLCPKDIIHSLVFDPRDPATLYAGTGGAGVYKVKPGN
jgi:photosystem II stability/assembly factor-like uncharacterized protein